MCIKILNIDKGILNVDKIITLMSHRLYNKGMTVQESSQTVWPSSDNSGFDMMSVY